VSEDQLIYEIKRIGGMYYSPELSERQESLKRKLKVLQNSKQLERQG
jgi:hypothetical protein